MDIELRNVWYSYDGVNYVLKGVSLKLSSGFHIVVGPNGSGKTTLLKIASLIYKPVRGEVIVNNSNYWALSPNNTLIRKEVVYVHERALLIRGSVKNNLELGLKLRGINDDSTLKYFIERYNLFDIIKKDVRKLSAGQAKLVSIIRALAVKPKALLLDEPLNHIDMNNAVLLIEDLTRLVRDGSTVVVATHYITPDLEGLADSMYEVVNGVLTSSTSFRARIRY